MATDQISLIMFFFFVSISSIIYGIYSLMYTQGMQKMDGILYLVGGIIFLIGVVVVKYKIIK